MLMRRWTPPSQVPTTSLDTTTTTANVQVHRTRLRWCKVLVAALIPIVLFSFCVVYTIQKQTFFNENYRREQNDDHDKQQRLLSHTYMQDISNVLLQMNDKNSFDEKHRLYIETKTLILLKNLDVKYKKDILLFLYQMKLIQNNHLNLHTANFNNLEFVCPYDFHQLYLFGVQWSNGILSNCRLTLANFDQANLFNTRFLNSTIINASFVQTNLDNSQFIQTIILNTDFHSASLKQSDFLQADIVQGNKFTNADLYQAKLTQEQIEGKKFFIHEHDFSYARYPNGSFLLLNSNENLILNGDAEICTIDNQAIWIPMDVNMNLSIERNDEILNNTNSWGTCSFVSSTKIRVYQNIALHSYSLLIDTDNAALSFSAFANCNQTFFELHIYRADGIMHDLKSYTTPTEEKISYVNETMYRYGEDNYHLPIHTRSIKIYFGVESQMKCYFDNIKLTIGQK